MTSRRTPSPLTEFVRAMRQTQVDAPHPPCSKPEQMGLSSPHDTAGRIYLCNTCNKWHRWSDFSDLRSAE